MVLADLKTSFMLSGEMIDTLLNLFLNNNLRKEAIKVFRISYEKAIISNKHIIVIIKLLLSELSIEASDSSNNKGDIIYLLAQLGDCAATQEVIEALFSILNNQYGPYRAISAEALGQICKTKFKSDTVKNLVNVLKSDLSDIVRISAFKALESLSSDNSPEIIEALLLLFKRNRLLFKEHLYSIFCHKIKATLEIAQIFNLFSLILEEKDYWIVAVDIYSIIILLSTRLSEEIGELTQKKLINTVFVLKLILFLKDKFQNFTQHWPENLIRMMKRYLLKLSAIFIKNISITIEDINENKLLLLFLDILTTNNDIALRCIAIHGLGAVNKVAPEVQNALLASLNDSNPQVKYCTIQSISRLGHTSPELYQTFATALNEAKKEEKTRELATAVTPEYIKDLLVKLKDNILHDGEKVTVILTKINLQSVLTHLKTDDIQLFYQHNVILAATPLQALAEISLKQLENPEAETWTSFLAKQVLLQGTPLTLNPINYTLAFTQDKNPEQEKSIDGIPLIPKSNNSPHFKKRIIGRFLQIFAMEMEKHGLPDHMLQAYLNEKQDVLMPKSALLPSQEYKYATSPQVLFSNHTTLSLESKQSTTPPTLPFYRQALLVTEWPIEQQQYYDSYIIYLNNAWQAVKIKLNYEDAACKNDPIQVLYGAMMSINENIRYLDLSDNRLGDRSIFKNKKRGWLKWDTSASFSDAKDSASVAQIQNQEYGNLTGLCIAKFLNNRKHLHTLVLSKNCIQTSSFESILEGLNKSPSIKYLFLDHNYISFEKDFCKNTFKRLLDKSGVKLLDLSMNFIYPGKGKEDKNVHGHVRRMVYDQATLTDELKEEDRFYCQHHFRDSFVVQSHSLQPIHSVIDSKETIRPDQGVVALMAYKTSVPPFGEHAFLMLEGIHEFGQRFMIMGDLFVTEKGVRIQISYCSPAEFLHRTGYGKKVSDPAYPYL